MRIPRILAKMFWPFFVLLLGMLLLGRVSFAQEKPTRIGPPPASTANAGELEKILTDRMLWEDDALAVFGFLDRWKNAGETSIIIYPEKVAGGTKSETLEGAKQSLAQMVAGRGSWIHRLGARLASPFGRSFSPAPLRPSR